MPPIKTHFKALPPRILGDKASEYTSYASYTLYLGTWNVNAKYEEDENIKYFLNRDFCGNDVPDIVCIGLQEVIELSPTKIVGSTVAGLASEHSLHWQEQFTRALTSGCFEDTSYELIQSVHMVGLLLLIYVRSPLVPVITNIQTASITRGAGGYLGNKGAVYIRLSLQDTSICFICAHLAAQREAILKRNEDYHAIVSKTAFVDANHASVLESRHEVILPSSTTALHDAISTLQNKLDTPSVDTLLTQSPLDSDIILFFGDLNYRISEELSRDDIYRLIYSTTSSSTDNTISQLLPYDQLLLEQFAGRAFDGFKEGPITFTPTYQYIPGTDIYDQRADKKMREPAYCDRILWHDYNTHLDHSSNYSGVGLQQMSYEKCKNNISDHKPVASVFKVTVECINWAHREEMLVQFAYALPLSVTPAVISVKPLTLDKALHFDIANPNSEPAIVNISNTLTPWVRLATTRVEIAGHTSESVQAEVLLADVEQEYQRLQLSPDFVPLSGFLEVSYGDDGLVVVPVCIYLAMYKGE